MVVPLFVGRDKSVNALEKAMHSDKKIFLSAQTKAKTDNPTESDIYRLGTVANILQILRLPDGTVKVLVEGDSRARVMNFIAHADYFLVQLEPMEESGGDSLEIEALRRGICSSFEAYASTTEDHQEVMENVAAIEDPSRLADTIASYMPFKLEVKRICSKPATWPSAGRAFRPHPRRDRDHPDRRAHQRPRQEADGKDPA